MALLRRYSETRRPHPSWAKNFSVRGKSLLHERALMEPIRKLCGTW